MLPAIRGAPVQATHLAAPPGSAGSRLPRLKRTPPPAPTMQSDKTSGDPLPPPPARRLLQLPRHSIHGWRAQQAAQPLQPLRSLHARQLHRHLTPVQRPGMATLAPRPPKLSHHMIHGWRAQQDAHPPQPRRFLRARRLQPSRPPVQRPGPTAACTMRSGRLISSA